MLSAAPWERATRDAGIGTIRSPGPLFVLMLAWLLAGCAAPASPAPASPAPASPAPAVEEAPVSKDLTLEWSLQADPAGGALRVHYTLHNGGEAPVLVLDDMAVLGATSGYDAAPEAMNLYADAQDPTLVHLARGRVQPYGRPRMEIIPGVRALAAGATLSGDARVPLPLRSWHPNDGYRALPATPTRASLQIGVLPGDTPTVERPLNGGSQRVAEPPAPLIDQTWVVGEARTLP